MMLLQEARAWLSLPSSDSKSAVEDVGEVFASGGLEEVTLQVLSSRVDRAVCRGAEHYPLDGGFYPEARHDEYQACRAVGVRLSHPEPDED